MSFENKVTQNTSNKVFIFSNKSSERKLFGAKTVSQNILYPKMENKTVLDRQHTMSF